MTMRQIELERITIRYNLTRACLNEAVAGWASECWVAEHDALCAAVGIDSPSSEDTAVSHYSSPGGSAHAITWWLGGPKWGLAISIGGERNLEDAAAVLAESVNPEVIERHHLELAHVRAAEMAVHGDDLEQACAQLRTAGFPYLAGLIYATEDDDGTA